MTEADGMRHREANGGVQSAGIRASDGRLWFPTQAGAVVIDPGRLAINEVAPPVAIEAVMVRGREGVRTIDLQTGSGSSDLVLEAGERDLQIAYAGLSFIEPERVRFRYRLSPLQSDWVEAGSRRQAIFTNVPPGRDRFEVLDANEDGVWSTEGASLLLSVPARFYETTCWPAESVPAATVSKIETAAPAATASSGNDAGDRRRVLVVDDNADLRAYLRRVLRSRFEVWEAEDGEAGLVAAREALPDLVVAGVMMPRMDGFAFGAKLTAEISPEM